MSPAPLHDLRERLPAGARVLVGLSGGVDSSVAAALLKSQGFDVVGVSLHLWEDRDATAAPSRCCAPEDLDDARATSKALGIPHFTFDRQAEFAHDVVEPFVDAYVAGVTPSPCVACNRDVKIAAFIGLCRHLGAAAFATGHYARTGFVADGAGSTRPALLRGHDRDKDQSYFLFGIGARALSLLITPLGALTKDRVRAMARDFALPNADKPDSEDLCFVAGDHAGFVERRAPERVRPGPIVDAQGRVVGAHAGVHRFTIGQRKGLGVSLGKPAFVASIDVDSATVHLGDEGALAGDGALIDGAQWIDPNALVAGARQVRARIRYRHDGADARLVADPAVAPSSTPTRVRAHFVAPVRAVTPGQTCVFYDGDEVLGGGTIVRALVRGELADGDAADAAHA